MARPRTRFPEPCRIDGCTKKANVPGTARGLCSTHYHRWKRTGDPLLTLTDLKPKASPVCSVAGCEKAKWAHGLCPMHLYRLKTRGEVGGAEPELRTPSGPCRIAGCTRPNEFGIHSLCNAHYLRQFKCRGMATIDQLEARIAYFGGRCWICGAPWECLDHVKPVSAGGPDLPANFRPACTSCNSTKRKTWLGSHRLDELVALVHHRKERAA
jgi:hypothetical protein